LPYAELTRAAKKLFLFLSPQNAFWSLVMENEPTQEEIAALFDIAPTTFSHWKHSWAVGPESLRKIFVAVERLLATGEHVFEPRGKSNGKPKPPRKHLLSADNLPKARELFRSFRGAYEDDAVDVYTTAKMMGMTINDCQQLLDGMVYHKAPLFTGMYYDSDTTATAYIDKYAGIYLMWVRRSKRWLQCPMRVRYILPINGLPTIRCKLNAPILRKQGNETYWEYDGFLAARDNRNYWVFEKRKKAERYDQFYCITGRGFDFCPLGNPGGKHECLTMRGSYLTAHQNLNQEIVGDVVFMQRQKRLSEDEETSLMHSSAHALAADESAAVQAHYNAFVKYMKEELI
jgi:hypothetical protein